MKYLLVVFTLVSVFACKSEPKFAPEMLLGNWQGADWKVQGKSDPGRQPGQVTFFFEKTQDDALGGLYVASYGSQKEMGAYRVSDDKLYTKAQGEKIEKVVRIIRLNADTLALDMNRSGTQEELVLVARKQ